jgi:CheY-like chemotaxis protein
VDHPLRVLILDDQPADAELSAHLIANGGFPCTWRRVDTEATFRAGLRSFQPDLILSDFTLPGYDGLSALDVAAREVPQTPFIFVSGSIGEQRASDALTRGASDYVPKTALNKLVPAVKSALSKRPAAGIQESHTIGGTHRLRRLHGVLDAFSRFRAAAADIHTPQALLHEACERLYASGQYDYAFTALATADSLQARAIAWFGNGADIGRHARFSIGTSAEHDGSITGLVLRTGETVIYFDSEEYRGPISPSERVAMVGRSILAFPLLAEGVTQGTLTLGASTSIGISEPELLIIEKFTQELARRLFQCADGTPRR